MRNGAKSYTRFKDSVDGNQSGQDTVWSNDPIGVIKEIEEYKENVKETNLDSPAQDPFAAAAALPDDDLPFGNPSDEDPFANVA